MVTAKSTGPRNPWERAETRIEGEPRVTPLKYGICVVSGPHGSWL